jgi:PAS domain S-box-containing protein
MTSPHEPDANARPSGPADVGGADQLRLFIENVREYAIFTLDIETRITTWNSGAERLLGWSESEAIGQAGEMIFTPEDRASGEAARELRTADEQGSAADERFHMRKDGSRFWATGMLMAVRDEDGNKRGYAKIMRDNTERREAQESLEHALRQSEAHRVAAERANHAKDEFVSTVSHELRTPLNTILLWSTMLSSGKLSREDWMKGIRVIERAASAQRQLIDDLLDVSRMESRKLRLAMRPMHLVDILENAVDSVRPMLESRDLSIERKFSDDIGVVIADPERIQQVVWNLIANSIKFTPDKGGCIRIDASRNDDVVEIRVSDTGTGIAPDFLPHVFDRFRQAEGSSTRTHSGLGLGLAIAKQIVELHGGTITAASEGTGHGATFTVRLPHLQVLQPGPDLVATAAARTEALSGVKILLVEDDVETRTATRRLLELDGATVRVAGDAAEASAAYVAETPDLLLSDIALPNEDGLSLIRRLRHIEHDSKLKRVPALAVTAFARVDDEQAALTAGFDKHVAKPVDGPGLVASIVEVLGASRAE